MSTGFRNTLAIIAFLVVLFWAFASAAPSDGASETDRYPSLVICEVFGPRCHQAVKVAYCESRFNTRAVSHTRDVGLFQVNYSAHHRRGESFAAFKRRFSDVRTNVTYAYRLSRRGTTWGAWKWSRHCHGLN